MKKLQLLCLAAILCLFIFGCGTEDPDDDEARFKVTTPTATVTPTPSPTPTPVPKPKYSVCLDPGHGGKWEGAIYGREERNIVLQLAKEIRAYLNENYPDIEVTLTREDNTTFSDDLGKDLRARVEFAVEHDARILVSLHLNASDKHNLRGAMVCVSKQPNIHDISVELGNAIMKNLETIGIRNRGCEWRNSGDTFDPITGDPMDYYAICRHGADLGIPAIIVESLFMDNKEDAKLIETDEGLKKIAALEAEAIAAFLYEHYSDAE